MAESGHAALTVAQAWELLAARVPAFRPRVETVSVADAAGRVLAQAPHAVIDVPAADKSAMDGFAIDSGTVGPGQTLAISQRVAAGDRAAPLQPGTAARIFTGAMVPAGADCIVIQENCRYDQEEVTVIRGITAAAHIRRRGEDLRGGSLLLRPAHSLRPQDIGLLLTAGVSHVEVFAPLNVAIIATGDELLDIGAAPEPHKTYESNAPMIAAALAGMGCRATRYRAADTLQATQDILRAAAKDNDAVITIGGVSVGEEDYVRAALHSMGQVAFWKIQVKPGKPFLFGAIEEVPVMGLPGNPVSSFVTFGLFCRPFLEQLRGAEFAIPRTWTALADFTTTRASDRQEYLRGTLERNEGQLHVRRLRAQGSGMQSALCAAEVLIVVPAETLVTRGQELEVIAMSDFVAPLSLRQR